MDQKDLLRFWTHINKLSLQVSAIKEEFARLINEDSGTSQQATDNDNSGYLVKPCR